jgi:predicted  nucleic acid-binding Zn-ribbon protein
MPESVNPRVARLEYLMGRLAEKQEKLDDVLVLLTEAQIKTEQRFQETGLRFKETEESIRETSRLIRETGQHLREVDQQSRERDRALDERVDKLVSAIGEMLRNGRRIL